MRRELEELAGDGRSFDAPSRVITVVGSIGETIDPDGARRERERLIAEARARYPGNVAFVFLRTFTAKPGGPKIEDRWNLRTGPERRREVPRPATKGPLLTPDAPELTRDASPDQLPKVVE
jgi:hypothetical protein